MIDEEEIYQIDVHLAGWGFIVRIYTPEGLRSFTFEKTTADEQKKDVAIAYLNTVITALEDLRDDLAIRVI